MNIELLQQTVSSVEQMDDDSIASSKLADVNDTNTLDGRKIYESLNSNRIEEDESTRQIEIVADMTNDISKACEHITFLAESIGDCRLEVERNENNNNYHDITNVLAECEITSTVENEQNNDGPHSIEEVLECETMKQSAEAIDIDQSRLDGNKRSTIKFFCENLDELKDNFQS